jgi:hypothetical protein
MLSSIDVIVSSSFLYIIYKLISYFFSFPIFGLEFYLGNVLALDPDLSFSKSVSVYVQKMKTKLEITKQSINIYIGYPI